MNVLDLFSGIGGFSLGLERAGMRTVAFCEIDEYCQRVLRKHWPDVPIYGDIREFTAEKLMADADGNGCGDAKGGKQSGLSTRQKRRNFQSKIKKWESLQRQACGPSIDVICGGFPCQDISVAGKGAGIEGSRSGLWSEYARIIGEVRPHYVIVENVAALLGRGLERVLGDLATLGFDAEWHCIPASAVGAPHRRDRVWIVAHAIKLSERRRTGRRETIGGRSCDDPERSGDDAVDVANTTSSCSTRFSFGEEAAYAMSRQCSWWLTEPDVGRVAHGVPARVDRLRSLGNAVVPQIPEIIGRAIMSAHNDR